MKERESGRASVLTNQDEEIFILIGQANRKVLNTSARSSINKI